jgi:regulator of sigma E protease
VESLILPAIAVAEVLDTARYIAMVALGLGFVIFVHELGHFLVAKACGVKCDKFYIGFDVPIPLGFFTIPGKLVHFQWGETEYGIGAIPLGGYVKMLGQDDNPNNAEAEAERTRVRDEQGNTRLDPRSYQAKSVPQRMAIISAGVIVNIIFGFFFAAIAYRTGVNIAPAVVGSVTAGDPAWQNNLGPGDRILALTADEPANEHMRFGQDMMVNLMLYTDFGEKLDVLVRHPDGSKQRVSMMPGERLKGEEISRPTLGITASLSPKFGKRPKLLEKVQAAELAKVRDGDRIVAIDGEPVEIYADIQRLLAARPGSTIELTIEKAPPADKKNPTTPERYTVQVPALPARDFGVQMKAGPITAIRKGSPAENAGLQVGDRLVAYQGKPIGDPLAFPQRTVAQAGETVELTVQRTVGEKTEEIVVKAELERPRQTSWSGVAGATVAVETLGVAYNVSAEVAEVVPGGPAEGQLQPGDKIVKAQFKAADDEAAEIERDALGKTAYEEFDLKKAANAGWPRIVDMAAARLPSTALVVTVLRDGKEVQATLTPRDSKELFNEDRNLHLTGLQEVHQAKTWSEAASLGAREMKERMTEVFTVVRKLVTGKISLFNLGGPVQIFTVATAQAKLGVVDLLMFFAFLSANLAVMNFLPIPALDGGHMLFLMYEAIFRKPVNEELQMKLSLAGILCLLSLMVFATALDISKFF